MCYSCFVLPLYFFRPEHFLMWHHSMHALHDMEACVFFIISFLQILQIYVLNIFFLFFPTLSSWFPFLVFLSSSPLSLSFSLFLSFSSSLVVFFSALSSSSSLFFSPISFLLFSTSPSTSTWSPM